MMKSTRRIADLNVSAISFGAMSLSHAYGQPPPREAGKRLLNQAIDLGYTMIDTAALYGFGANEELIGEALAHRRSEYVLASKCGLQGQNGKRILTNDPATLKASCDASLRRLKTDVIDLFYLHRWDKVTPIEESVAALADLVEAGKVRYIGLSEVSSATLKRANAVHPVAAVQSEYSLCTREPEIAILETCRNLGTTFVAFSPVGRGFLTGKLTNVEALLDSDFRRNMPRFSPANYALNLELLDEFGRLAKACDCSISQLALAWLLHVDNNIVCIPGTTNPSHAQENIAAQDVQLDADAVAEADRIINRHTITGERYVAKTQAEIDTETFDDT